jgi:hypothetical protein
MGEVIMDVIRPSHRQLGLVLLVGGVVSVGVLRGEPEPGNLTDKEKEALRQELQTMVKEDQDARNAAIQAKEPDAKLEKRIEEIVAKTTKRMKEIVGKFGWPGKSMVGEEGAHNAWLLVQHADRESAFQKQCLPLLEKAVKKGEASGKDLAYLTDRVLVADKKKQLYGTQFTMKDGELVPSPIEDEANVDKRRKEVGLETMAEYTKILKEVYKPKPPEKK